MYFLCITKCLNVERNSALFLILFGFLLLILCLSEITAEGRRITKLDQILLNGNNIAIVSEIHWFLFIHALPDETIYKSKVRPFIMLEFFSIVFNFTECIFYH